MKDEQSQQLVNLPNKLKKSDITDQRYYFSGDDKYHGILHFCEDGTIDEYDHDN